MKYVILLALVASAFAAPKPEDAAAVPAAQQPSQLSELLPSIAEVQQKINDFTASIKDQLSIPDQETINTFKSQSTEFFNKVQEHANQFSTDAQKNINDFAASIRDQVSIPDQETLKNQSANFFNNIHEFFNQISTNIKDKAPEFGTLLTEATNELSKLSKAIKDININVPNAKESTEKQAPDARKKRSLKEDNYCG